MLHVPAFLIASITSRCNLNCAGCYSRHNKATVDTAPVQQLTGDEWLRIFREAEELGISCRRMPSGAGPDAMCFPEICPAGMVFIPCRGGISHNRKEYTSYKSIADGAAVMYRYLKDKYGTKA